MCFLGIRVHRDKERKIIHINPSGYIRTILNSYGMQNSKTASTSSQPARTFVLADQKDYQSIVGSITHGMLATRPDLAQCIQQISQLSQKANENS